MRGSSAGVLEAGDKRRGDISFEGVDEFESQGVDMIHLFREPVAFFHRLLFQRYQGFGGVIHGYPGHGGNVRRVREGRLLFLEPHVVDQRVRQRLRVLAESAESDGTRSILRRVKVSVDAHGSELIAVVAHADCAGNPTGEEEQRRQIARSAEYLAQTFPGVSVIGLWVDDRWTVSRTCSLEGVDRDAR